MRLLVILALAAGCAVNTPEPQVYTCTILYRCAGDEAFSGAIALPCAADLEHANELATELGIRAATERCATPWQYVRPLCAMYEPATSCELESD